ncbi:MAG: hypothetical protein ABSA40_02610 [Candidatus Dormibacteria bacterium]|jgi:hypothetical protein
MFSWYTLELLRVERPRTAAELRESDIRRGELAAATFSSWRALTAPARAFGRARGRPRPAAAEEPVTWLTGTPAAGSRRTSPIRIPAGRGR